MSSHGANEFYPWYVRHFRSSRKVQRQRYIARGLYRELLDEQFLEGSLPNDLAALADICGCPLRVMEKAWPEIMPCFQEIDGRLVNLKLEELRTAKDQLRVKRVEYGRRGGIAKQRRANANQMPDAGKQADATPDATPDSDTICDPSMVCSAVMDDLRISGKELRIVLDSVCAREMARGTTGEELRSALVNAHQQYQAAKPRLTYTVGDVKFFGEWWHNSAGWPWKDGEAPKREPAAGPNSYAHPSRVIGLDVIRAKAGLQ